jgi:alginate O-acetyltransferase complex protein AlgI
VLFNSFEYLVFYLIILALCWATVGWPRLRVWVLLLGSYYFYASNNHWLILLLIFTTHVDWLAGLYISRTQSPKARKLWLAASMTLNVGMLAYFKYVNFFAASASSLAEHLGLHLGWVDLNVILPVGISFYTFQSMTYTIDVYRRVIPAEKNWCRFAFFVAYFPHLIAGPIVRASVFLHQIGETPRLDADALDEALMRIFRGLFKKIVLADFLARYADAAFDHPAGAGFVAAWVGVYAFAFQIYFDFSGYTDLALGCARLMGFRLSENFDRPYAAGSFSDFWRRWHITLSAWLRDYLYIPLGGSRTGSGPRNLVNLMVTMTLCGLWHGAAWTFVLWGAMHGTLLAAERWLGLSRDRSPAPAWRSLLLFHLVALMWVPFRARDFGAAAAYARELVGFAPSEPFTVGMLAVLVISAAGWLAQYWSGRARLAHAFLRLPLAVRAGAYAVCWALVMVFNSGGAKSFIYFQF